MMSEEVAVHKHDVVVIGAGGAGLRAAIESMALGCKTAVVCKSLFGKAHTVMAEGGMAAALITTLYGAVFANLFFLPMADKMGNKTTQTSMSAALLVEAARLIHQKKHPLIVREKLNSFIPPGEWKSE